MTPAELHARLPGLAPGRRALAEALAQYAKPEQELSVSEWADRYRKVSAESGSRYPGPWATSRTPYLREPMDCLHPDHPARRVTLKFSAQTGKSEIPVNWFGFVVDRAPGTMLLVLPSLDEAIKFIRAKFVRESGGAVPALSASFLANAVVAAVDVLAGVVGSVFAIVADVIGVVEIVFDAVIGVIETVAAVVDTIIAVATVVTDAVDLADFVVSLGQDAYDVVADVRSAAVDLVRDTGAYLDRATGATPEYAERVFEMVRDLGSVMRPRDAVRAFSEAIGQFQDEPVAASAPLSVQQAAANANEARRVFRLAALGGYTEAVIRVPYASRDEGITARADLVELYEAELEVLTGAERAPLFVALSEARNAAVALLSQTIANLAPVVTVSASVSLPSLFWAWRLYQDPTRAGELTARNKVQHPSFFPTSFEALAR